MISNRGEEYGFRGVMNREFLEDFGYCYWVDGGGGYGTIYSNRVGGELLYIS
jgi:hypothetical protein